MIKDEAITCLYIPESKLHLMPFYDLQKMKKFSEKRPDYEKVKQTSMKRYHTKVIQFGGYDD